MNSNRTDTIWNANLQNMLTKWWETEGYTSRRISEEFGRMGYAISRSAVIGKAHRLKLTPAVRKLPLAVERAKTAAKTERMQHQSARIIIHREYKPYRPKEVSVSTPKPNGSKAVLLRDSNGGQCKAIIGYVNGRCEAAVYCGEPVVTRTTLGSSHRIRLSWCRYHKSIYFHEAKGG